MKTLTTNQIAEINKLYSKYNASQEKQLGQTVDMIALISKEVRHKEHITN